MEWVDVRLEKDVSDNVGKQSKDSGRGGGDDEEGGWRVRITIGNNRFRSKPTTRVLINKLSHYLLAVSGQVFVTRSRARVVLLGCSLGCR